MGISDEAVIKGKKILIDEERIPFQDSFLIMPFLIHYLENNHNTKLSLEKYGDHYPQKVNYILLYQIKNHLGIYLIKVLFLLVMDFQKNKLVNY